jgi:hypoxanthine phosphoribosyltransferase
MKKQFIPHDSMRNNAIKLAHRIYRDGFIPDVIYTSLRGGAYLGNVVSEYFKIVRKDERPAYYAAVVVRSYTDLAQREKIHVEGWTYPPEHLRSGDKVLLCDDVFDSGRTVNHLAAVIMEKGIPRKDLKIAVHDYKYFFEKTEQLPVQPDYWCCRYDIGQTDQSPWLHYLSHELIGLSTAELEQYFYAQDGELRDALKVLEDAS